MFSVIPETMEEMNEAYAYKDSIVETIKQKIESTDDLQYAFALAGLYLESNAYGTLLQSWLERKYGWENIPQNQNRGDFDTSIHKNVELKISLDRNDPTNAVWRANLLNLRLDSPANYYLFIAHQPRKPQIQFFFVPKDDVIHMVDLFSEGKRSKHNTNHAEIRIDMNEEISSYMQASCLSYLSRFQINEENLRLI